jgi:hypothetical protein
MTPTAPSSGLPGDAALLAGIGRRELRVLGAPIGSGKTSLALHAAVRLCRGTRQHVVYVRGRETHAELTARVPADQQDLFQEFGIDRVGESMHAAIPLMAEPRIWVEDPAWLLEYETPPFFVHWLLRHSPIPCGLVVVDALADMDRELHGLSLPPASEDVLAVHQISSLEQAIPRLVVVDMLSQEIAAPTWVSSAFVPLPIQ